MYIQTQYAYVFDNIYTRLVAKESLHIDISCFRLKYTPYVPLMCMHSSNLPYSILHDFHQF